MTIKNILDKVRIHILYWLLIVIACFTGYFKDLIIFTSIIIIHELGHILIALKYNWHIKKIIILPLGGITVFEDIIDKPLKEEFILAINGPLMQAIYTIIINLVIGINPIFNYYSMIILIFNMLPIYPLDGAKILNIIFNKIWPFKFSYLLMLSLSCVLLSLLLFLANNLILFLGLSFLAFNLIKEYKNFAYLFKSFLLERLLYKIKYKKTKIIKGLKFSKMYRNCHHFFIIDNNKLTEEYILAKTFDFTRLL